MRTCMQTDRLPAANRLALKAWPYYLSAINTMGMLFIYKLRTYHLI